MRKRPVSTGVCVCICLVLLVAVPASASVSQGRALLFNNGNPTYSGILSANAIFEDEVTSNPSNQEANFFYAATRLAAFILEDGGGSGLNNGLDLLEAFGVQRGANDELYAGAPYGPPPELFGDYDPPATIPDGEEIRAFMAGPLVDEINGALSNLAVVQNTFATTLTVAETGMEADVEVDYGDVLLFRSVLQGVKAFIQIAVAYDLDFDVRSMIALGNAEILQFQRDLLDSDPSLFALRGDGSTSLGNARQSLLTAIQFYSDMLAFVGAETDYQGDDLFFFDSAEEEREADYFLAQLSEIADSIDDNRTAQLVETDEEWILTVDQDDTLEMEIEKYANGDFLYGEIFSYTGCQPLFCWAKIDSYEQAGSELTITASNENSCPATAELTGTRSGDQIVGGAYTVTDCNGTRTGSFTGILQYSETNTVNIDVNRIFGNSGKSPLNLRAVMPQFDRYNQPLPGTFPSPVLNGILPDYPTNDALTRGWDLQPAGFKEIPVVAENAITINGNLADWPVQALMFTDITGDEDQETPTDGNDIYKLYLAKDSNDLYIAIQLADNGPSADGTVYVFQANQSFDSFNSYGDRCAYAVYESGAWLAGILQWSWPWEEPTDLYVATTGVATGPGIVEWKVPLSDMGQLSGRFINVFSRFTPTENNIDENRTRIMLDSPTISGSVSSSTGGPIFVGAYNSWGDLVKGTYVTNLSEPYEIEGLTDGETVYLYALWDADGNGILSDGDYLEYGGSFVAGSSAGIDFTVNSPPPSIDILGNIINVHEPDDTYQTYVTIDVGTDFPYPLPSSLEHITVSGPNGLNLSMEDFTYYPQWREFGAIIPGQPAIGTYKFQVLSGHYLGADTDDQTVIRNIPIPDPATFTPQPDGSVRYSTPQFSWGAVDYNEATMFYRLEIGDPATGQRVYATSRTANMLDFSVPNGILEVNMPYRWRIRVTDSGSWEQVQNRANSSWFDFTVRPSAMPFIPLLLDEE